MPRLSAADTAARPISNLPNVTLQVTKETYLLLRYRMLWNGGRLFDGSTGSSGTLGILPFMAKWTLGILDGGGWGCGRADDFLWTRLYSYRMLRATTD